MSYSGPSAMVIASSLGSAFCFATSSVAKHSSASHGPPSPNRHLRSIWRFVRATVRHPLWLLGMVADVGGLVLQIVALAFGALTVVQPLLLSGLVFAIVLRAAIDRYLALRQLGWAVVVTMTLAGSLAICRAGSSSAQPVDRLPAAITAVGGLVAVAVAVVIGTRSSRVTLRAGLTGAAAGALYAAGAALLKVVTTVARHGLFPLLGSWQLYSLIVVGAAGLVIGQISFQAGPLAIGLPAAATVDPLLSVVIGVVVFDEPLLAGPGHGVLLAALLLVLLVAVVRLAVEAEGASAPHRAQTEIGDALPGRIDEPLGTQHSSHQRPRHAGEHTERPIAFAAD